jgi:hypothetical protein
MRSTLRRPLPTMGRWCAGSTTRSVIFSHCSIGAAPAWRPVRPSQEAAATPADDEISLAQINSRR